MPSLRVHCRISKDRTGFNFKELHEWIDESAKEKGINHRMERHAYTKVEERLIKNYWNRKKQGLGEKAVVEWLFHIAIDNLDTAFKRAKKAYNEGKIYNYFRFCFRPNSKFILFDSKILNEEDVEKEFGDTYVFE